MAASVPDTARRQLSAAAESELRTLVSGAVHTPADPGYADATALHNGAVEARPAVVVQVASTIDVLRTVQFARRHRLELSVRGGGHGVGGQAMAGDVVIDLSARRTVRVDPDACTAVVQGGATWADVDAAAQAHALAVPGGRISHTGVGGLTLGGGEGWLSTRHGLTSDNLISADLVTADGVVVTADADRTPELFWALRGGGGNFGVVVSFTFRLHPVGPTVLSGHLGYALDDAPEVLGVLDHLHRSGHDDFAGAAAFLTAPPAPFVPDDVVGRPIVAVIPAWFGDIEYGQELIRPLREQVRPIFEAIAPMPYVALQQMLDQGSPKGMRNRWSGSFVSELDPDLVHSLQGAARNFPGPLSQILLSPLSDAVRRLPTDATAFPARDGGRWLVHPVGVWQDPDIDELATTWVRDVAAAARRSGETGSYLNVDDSTEERVRWAMGDVHYRRLQQVKAAWDPDDVFRHCPHVRPAL